MFTAYALMTTSANSGDPFPFGPPTNVGLSMHMKFFGIAIFAIAAAVGLVRLGALSVLVGVLSLALKAMSALLIAAAGIALALFMWKRIGR